MTDDNYKIFNSGLLFGVTSDKLFSLLNSDGSLKYELNLHKILAGFDKTIKLDDTSVAFLNYDEKIVKILNIETREITFVKLGFKIKHFTSGLVIEKTKSYFVVAVSQLFDGIKIFTLPFGKESKSKVILHIKIDNVSKIFYQDGIIYTIGKLLSAICIKNGEKYLKNPDVTYPDIIYQVSSIFYVGVLLSRGRILTYHRSDIKIVENGKTRKFELKGFIIHSLAVSSDGNKLYILGKGKGFKLDVWDVNNSPKLKTSYPLKREHGLVIPEDEDHLILTGTFDEKASSVLNLKTRKISAFPLEYSPFIENKLILFPDTKKIKFLKPIILSNFKNYLPSDLVLEIFNFFK